ncbi:hypothetical protein SHLI107390_15245 [Shewanella livingstonensis]
MILKVMLVVGFVAVFGIGCVSATGNIAPSLSSDVGEFSSNKQGKYTMLMTSNFYTKTYGVMKQS